MRGPEAVKMPSDVQGDAVSSPLRVAIVGAESTGKSALARSLADALRQGFGLRCRVADEWLRDWCDQHGRTPRPTEQLAIAQEQQRRIDLAAASPGIDVVLCDTTPIMTAVYSALLFDDLSLDGFAHDCQHLADLTLLTALDLSWVGDGLQRDGPHVRASVDALIRDRLVAWQTSWALVAGRESARTDCAMDALRPLLRHRAEERVSRASGLFNRLSQSRQGPPGPAWVCEHCDLPVRVRPIEFDAVKRASSAVKNRRSR